MDKFFKGIGIALATVCFVFAVACVLVAIFYPAPYDRFVGIIGTAVGAMLGSMVTGMTLDF